MIKIFVFGSNLQGRHGKGAALAAKNWHGAIQGQAEGLQGKSYAIPTKITPYRSLDLISINFYVDRFKRFAQLNPQYEFIVTPIGCGLAGYKPEQIGPMFKDSPSNCILPEQFKPYAI